jgi:hypothetical protein
MSAPVNAPGKKSSPFNELSTILLPETEFNEKSAKVTPAFAISWLPILLSATASLVTAPSASLSVVTALFTKYDVDTESTGYDIS